MVHVANFNITFFAMHGPFFPFSKTLCYWTVKHWVRLPRSSVRPFRKINFITHDLLPSGLCSSVGRGAIVLQWWEHLPPSNVARVLILASTSYVGWVCCWFSPLLWEVFLRVLWFSPLLKNQHVLPNSKLIWNTWTCFNEFSWTPHCSVGKQVTKLYLQLEIRKSQDLAKDWGGTASREENL